MKTTGLSCIQRPRTAGADIPIGSLKLWLKSDFGWDDGPAAFAEFSEEWETGKIYLNMANHPDQPTI
jgi:hypothetical protein